MKTCAKTKAVDESQRTVSTLLNEMKSKVKQLNQNLPQRKWMTMTQMTSQRLFSLTSVAVHLMSLHSVWATA